MSKQIFIVFGHNNYQPGSSFNAAVRDAFIEEAKKHVAEVQASIVTHQRGVDETRCEEIAGKEFGIKYRARRYNIVG